MIIGSIKYECDVREQALQQVTNRVSELENLLQVSNEANKEKVYTSTLPLTLIYLLTLTYSQGLNNRWFKQ